jgi:hypothetical protein
VIVVLAFVGILATVALWVSLTNFQMKVTDKNVTDNFYSAEGVLDQIRVGLQNDVSDALGTAYTEVMKQYASKTEEERQNLFSSDYVRELSQKLQYSDETVTYGGATIAADRLCNIKTLKKYLGSSTIAADEPYTVTLKNGDTVVLKNGQNDSYKYCFLNIVSNGVAIDDLVVEYTDSTGNLSIIQTDILLQIPDLNMVSSENLPQVFDYCIIGNTGVEFQGPGTTLIGSVYAGSQYAINSKNPVHDATVTDDEYYKSLVIANTSYVDFTQAPYVIADGDIWVSGKKGKDSGTDVDTMITNATGQLWARNINLTNASALLSGTTYVGDDLTLLGDGSELAITGIYAGYGSNTSGDDGSSAIIINGKNSVLDMSAARSVVVAGYAYINTGAITTTNATTTTNSTAVEGVENSQIDSNSDIQLGESIMVKGDQIAYLVPSECVATVGGSEDMEGKSRYKKNPLTVAEYKAVLADEECTLVDIDVTTKTGHPISTYLTEGQTADNAYRMVLVPSKTGNPDEGLVYLYLNLTPEMASSYFMDYYKTGDEKLKKYNAFYTNGINAVGDNATIYTAGTYVDYKEGKLDEKDVPLSLNYDKGTDSVNGSIDNLPSTYLALTTKLVTDYSLITEVDYDTVFKNVIDRNYFKNFMIGQTFTASQAGTGGEELRIVLTDNEGGAAYEFNDSDPKHVYIIIATGDVNVNTNFTGTLIADGKVTVGNDSNITLKKTTIENIKKMMLILCENNNGESANLYTFFREGSVYISSGFVGSSSGSSTTSDEISLSDLVVYQNWKKK